MIFTSMSDTYMYHEQIINELRRRFTRQEGGIFLWDIFKLIVVYYVENNATR